MVEFDHDLFQFILYDRNEFSIFVNILADQSIHVFISATLPGSIRMSTEESLQNLLERVQALRNIKGVVQSGRGIRRKV